jgi:RNA polymerase sigma factor (sigma-70 family)
MIDARQERFRALYESTRPRLIAYALRRTSCAEDAADVIAETFAIGWRRIDDVPPGEASLLWLYGTARRVLANHHRRAHGRLELVARIGVELETARSTSIDETGNEAMVARLALSRLSDDDRELLMLTGWEGLDSAQLACVLGCSPAAARVRLHRARSRLVTEMAELSIWQKQEGRIRHPPLRRLEPEEAPEEASRQ